MKKKKILILGASGFIGKNVAIFFSKNKDFNVIGTFLKNKTKIKNVKMIKCDLTNRKNTDKITKGVDIIIQAAATTSGAKDIIEKPYLHVNDNAIINSMITRSAYDNKVKHVVVFSCSVMYQSSRKLIKENDFNPNLPVHPNYFGAAWMKIFIEKMCAFYAKMGRNKYTLIRHSNTYGPHDKFDLKKSHVLGASVNKVVNCKNNKVVIWGDGKEKRDLIFIDDLVNFIHLALINQKNKYELYNVGSGNLISINNLVKKIIKVYGKKIKVLNDNTKKTLRTSICLDTTKAKKELNWFPKISLNNGIKTTVDWYLRNKNIYN
jgi:GDP-L-fucose synthase